MATAESTPRPKPHEQLPSVAGPRLPYHPKIEEVFGVDKTAWRALVEAIFPNATSTEAVILALSYCKARRLDIFKRCVHIVPIWNKDLKRYVDTIWPGIGELRTTACRTGEYAGKDSTVFGPTIEKQVGSMNIKFPEWAQVNVYRMVRDQKVLFAGPKVYWEETYAVKKHDDDTPNEMWATRPRGQLDKCAEAAALRTAFPEEIGSDYIPEEVQHGNPKSKESIDALIGHEARTLDMIANEIEQPEPEPSQSGPLPPPDDDDDGPPNEARDDWSVFMGAVRAAKTLSDLKTTGDYWLKRDWGAARNTEALKVIAEREADIRAGKSKGKGTMFDKGNPPA